MAAASRLLQLQTQAAYFPLPITSTTPSRRTSAQSTITISSIASSAASLGSSGAGSNYDYTTSLQYLNPSVYANPSYTRCNSVSLTPSFCYNNDNRPYVETMRCSKCAMATETITSNSQGNPLRRVSTSDADASGMVRFGTNLYYCHSCAQKVGYHH